MWGTRGSLVRRSSSTRSLPTLTSPLPSLRPSTLSFRTAPSTSGAPSTRSIPNSFSAKLRRQRCCLAERCLQGILPACRPIHCPRPGARASKKRTRASAHIKWLFSTKQVVSPVLTSATGAAFLVCARKQRWSAFARLRSHRQRLRPVVHTLCSQGDNQETVQPRNSARYRRKTGETTCFFSAHREKPRVWALESHVTDNFTLRTMERCSYMSVA